MTSTHDLSTVTDALGAAFATSGLTLEPASGLADVAGTLTSVRFEDGSGSGTTPATLAVITDDGLDLFDAAVAALQKSMPGLVSGEPTALSSIAELDTQRPEGAAFHTILNAGIPVGLVIIEEDRRQTAPTGPGVDATASDSLPGSGPVPPSNTAPPSTTAVGAPASSGATAASGGTLSMLGDVMLNVTVDLGRQLLPLSEVMALSIGSVVELDRAAGAPVDIRVNGILFGRGEVVVVDDEYAVRIIEIVETTER